MANGRYMLGLECLRCGRHYEAGQELYVCSCRSNEGSDMGTLEVQFDYAAIMREVDPASLLQDTDSSIGRYWPLLPVRNRQSLPPLPVGNTPLYHVSRAAEIHALSKLYVKDDGRNPSASFKDRASAIAVARAREQGAAVVATASTGNAAAALAGQCAATGQRNVIFVPKRAPQAKVAQLLAFGSSVLAVDGSYDQAFDLCTASCQAFGWYNRNTGYNPYMSEGKKSVSFEICAQLGAQQAGSGKQPGATPFVPPDVVFVSVGDGCIIGGVYKGFSDLIELGWIERMPRIYGVQSTKSAALADAWQSGAEVPIPVQASTRADSINVDAPRDAIKALRAVRASGGAYIKVDDEEILQAIPALAQLSGVFAEPAGAAAYAGMLQAFQASLIDQDETIVVINTGSGLKDVPAVVQTTGAPQVIEPALGAVERWLSTVPQLSNTKKRN
jgi:threonine synthase